MARPSKTVSVIRNEGKSHRTKAELEAREKREKALLSGRKMRESAAVKGVPVAHAEWMRVRKILAAIEKDDAIYEGVMNRYCLLFAEAREFEEAAAKIEKMAQVLDRALDEGEIENAEYFDRSLALMRQRNDNDRVLQQKRKMLFDIERDNCMTVASAARVIPKEAPEEDDSDPMSLMLRERIAARNA